MLFLERQWINEENNYYQNLITTQKKWFSDNQLAIEMKKAKAKMKK